MNDKTKKQKTSLDSVDQIRNILFGEQVSIIEDKISNLEKNINLSLSNLEKKLQESHSSLLKNIDNSNKQLQQDSSHLEQSLTNTIDALESNLKNKIIETESDLVNQLQTGLDKLDNKASHRHELAQLLKEMADKLSD